MTGFNAGSQSVTREKKTPTGQKGPSAEKIIFHNKEQKHTKHFYVFTNPGLVEKWRKDKSVPLVEVLQSDIIYEGNGAAGNSIGQASNLELENAFGSKDGDKIRNIILTSGSIHQVN